MKKIVGSASKWPWDSSKLKPCLQSPINIEQCVAKKSEFPPLTITVPFDPCVELLIKNTGRGVSVEFDDKKAKKLSVNGGFLEDCYCLDNVHYHWGENSEVGSEHFVNGECFPAEVHMVTYKKEYKDFDTALQNEDGVVILAFFLEFSKKNEKLDKFMESVSQLSDKKCVKASGTDTICWFFPDLSDNNACSYYAYPGSLTTPPYTEIVTFILFSKPVPVCEDQLQAFKCLKDESGQPITSNRREIQPLKERPILLGGKVTWNVEQPPKCSC